MFSWPTQNGVNWSRFSRYSKSPPLFYSLQSASIGIWTRYESSKLCTTAAPIASESMALFVWHNTYVVGVEREGQSMRSSNQIPKSLKTYQILLPISEVCEIANIARMKLHLVRLIALSIAVWIGFAKIGNWIVHSSHAGFYLTASPPSCHLIVSPSTSLLFLRLSSPVRFICSAPCDCSFIPISIAPTEYLHMTLHAFSIINSRGMHSASFVFNSTESEQWAIPFSLPQLW